MTKSDELLENIDLDSCFYTQSKPNWSNNKQINAFDTETTDGTVFMLSYAIGDYSGVEYNEEINKLDSKQIFQLITNRQARSALNFWYNLDFDANAILSDLLTDRELTHLHVGNECKTKIDGIEYEITYVKSKFLRLQDENDNSYEHYDISQFFYTTLNNAAEEWLDENKKEDVDTKKFSNEEYVKDNLDAIIEYAEKDAKLTQNLANELITQAENLDIPMGKPFSTGYLSAEYLRANTGEKPDFYKYEIQNMFWDAYFGGRFEVFERGDIGDVVAPDINSAYPAIMQNLPDPGTLKWEKYENDIIEKNDSFGFTGDPFDFEKITESDFGVIRAIVTTNPNKKIQPFAYKLNGTVNFPVLTDTLITTIKPIFEFAVKNDYIRDYRLKEAWLGNTTDNTTYPFNFIGDVYADRKVAEVLHNKPKKGQLLKIVLNSLYGKTCQTTEKRKVVDLANKPENWMLEPNQKLIPRQYLSIAQRNELRDSEVLVGEQTSGRRFNPFIASYITGMTRLELHKQVENYNLVDDTVMFATDCLMVRKDAYEKSNFDELIRVPDETLESDTFREKVQQSLGYWDFDYEGKAFIVGSGIYEIDFEECKNEDCVNYGEWCDNAEHRMKTKTRGFPEKELDSTLRKAARENPKEISIDNTRPLTIGEILMNPDKGEVSEFVELTKKIYPDFDSKREWRRENPTFTDLLNQAEESKPRNLAEEQIEELKQVQKEANMAETNVNMNIHKTPLNNE